MQKFHYIYTRLNVENYLACKAFYRDVLGLPVKFEDDKDEYVEFATGPTSITLFNRQKLTDFIIREKDLNYDIHSARIVLSFQVQDIREAIYSLQKHQVEILNPPTDYPDRGFVSACFRDPDGNLIELEEITDGLMA